MAPKRVRKIKKIDAINNEFVKVLERIDVEEIDFGDVVFSDESFGVELESVEAFDEIVESLEQFLAVFKEQKEIYENNKLSGMVNEQLKAGGDNAKKLLALLAGNDVDMKSKTGNESGQIDQQGHVDNN